MGIDVNDVLDDMGAPERIQKRHGLGARTPWDDFLACGAELLEPILPVLNRVWIGVLKVLDLPGRQLEVVFQRVKWFLWSR